MDYFKNITLCLENNLYLKIGNLSVKLALAISKLVFSGHLLVGNAYCTTKMKFNRLYKVRSITFVHVRGCQNFRHHCR